MITATVDMTRFNAGLDGLIRQVGLNQRVVLEKETGELVKTLVRVSPKAAPEKIRTDIEKKFSMIENPARVFKGGRGGVHGSGDVDWYAANSHALYGVAKEADMRDASVEDLKGLLYKITPKGRIRGQRGRQAVYITKRILTKAATVRKLSALKAKNRGRLAAGWAVAVFGGRIRTTGKLPQFITRHASGARGYFVDNISSPDRPFFTIGNTARGVGKPQVNALVKTAVAIRGKAMAANALLFMRGKKNVGDYAR